MATAPALHGWGVTMSEGPRLLLCLTPADTQVA